MNDVRRRIASKLREKFDLIESSLLHPDGSEPNWSVEELFEVLDIDYPECLNPWECPYDYIADLIDVPACKDLVKHQPDSFIPTRPNQEDATRCAVAREPRQSILMAGRDYSGSFVTKIDAVIDDSIFAPKDVRDE